MTLRTLLFALAAGFLFATPLRAQTTDALDYVDHINVDFAHNTILNTNMRLLIALLQIQGEYYTGMAVR